jgi:hypothetical protein
MRISASISRIASCLLGAALAIGCTVTPLEKPEDLDLQGGETPNGLDDDDLRPLEDLDEDGVPNAEDNCPSTPNPGQEDDDLDRVGDVCDQCPTVSDPEQPDADDDGVGDACPEDPPSEEPPPDDDPPPVEPDPNTPDPNAPLCENGDDLCREGE